MYAEYSTGNEKVDAMASMQLSGNVIPPTWYRTVTRENGKPHLLAISILADIVYWYRPQEIREEQTGDFLGYKKKFRSDLLQRNYAQWADFFGESERSVRAAIVTLENLGVIKRVFRTVEVHGALFNNVLFIDLFPDRLYQITYPDENPECTGRCGENSDLEKPETGLEKSPGPVAEECQRVWQNFAGGVAEKCQRGDNILPEGWQNSATHNTKIITETTQGLQSSSSVGNDMTGTLTGSQTEHAPQMADDTDSGDDDDERTRQRINYNGAIKKYPAELVRGVYAGIRQNRDKFHPGEPDQEMFNLLCEKIAEYYINVRNQEAYIASCIDNFVRARDAAQRRKKEKMKPGSGGFNGFEQRDYDYEQLERELVGN